MRALIINLTTPNDPAANRDFTLTVLKDAAYNSKVKNPMNKSMNYDYIFVPMLEVTEEYKQSPKYKKDMARYLELLPQTLYFSQTANREAYYSLGKFLEKNAKNKEEFIPYLLKYRFYINIIDEISENDFGISYTDGSFNRDTNDGGHCCLVVNKDNTECKEILLMESTLQRECDFNIIAGKIENATNNSAELTAIRDAVKNSSKERFQLIISDCDYGMKSFRDYIFNWRLNGWKAANNKPIKNKELIQEIDSLLNSSAKIFLFQWTESHVGNPFNEMCDAIAKMQAGVGNASR